MFAQLFGRRRLGRFHGWFGGDHDLRKRST
jgi:hypothetical protein